MALEAAQKANPTLFKNKLEELQKIYPSDASATESNSLYPEIDASAVHNNIMSDIKTNACPPGKSLRQKTTFLGLIKLGKICLSDYEVEVLLQGERRNRALGSLKAPRVINCSSNTYGNYTSTSCY